MPYRSIEDPATLRRLLEAVFLIEADLALPVLLRHIIEEARSMMGAQYGALGILDESHTGLAEFITIGIDAEMERAIGTRPTGKGVLGLLILDPKPLRLANLNDHPDSYGFPPNHPAMKSFLGVPIMSHDQVYGNLYLTDKIGWAEFTKDDEELVMALARSRRDCDRKCSSAQPSPGERGIRGPRSDRPRPPRRCHSAALCNRPFAPGHHTLR